MNIEELAHFYRWADQEVQDSCNEVNDDDFVKKENEGRSLRELVEHFIISYEYLTFQGDFRKRIEYLSTISREELKQSWAEAVEGFVDKLVSLENREYDTQLEKKTIKLDRDHYTLIHTDHLTYHRGQISTKLRELGHTPKNTDYYTYLEQ